MECNHRGVGYCYEYEYEGVKDLEFITEQSNEEKTHHEAIIDALTYDKYKGYGKLIKITWLGKMCECGYCKKENKCIYYSVI